ncbi:MAG: hypothetical protein IPG71_06380 [bacterium]|nr:hypothetical protein [bacterium]
MHFRAILALSLLLSVSYAVADPIPVDSVQFTESPDGSSPLVNQSVEVTGLVSGVGFGSSGLQYFIMDPGGGPWSGLLVFDTQDRDFAIGDSVVLQGTVQESGSQTRLSSPQVLAGPLPSTSPISAFAATTGGVAEALEGVLIEVTNALVTEIIGSDFIVNDNSGELRVREGFKYAYEPVLGDTMQLLRGIVTYQSGEFVLNPRSDDDFVFNSNRPPIISEVEYAPELPRGADPVNVTAMITDDGDNIAEVLLYYRFAESGDFSSVSMHDDGSHGDSLAGDRIWGGLIPAGPERATARYYLLARDGQGMVALSPDNAPASTYTYFIRDIEMTIFNIQYTGDRPNSDSPFNTDIVTTVGIVTGANFDGGSNFFMSDPGGGPWSGVYVYGPSGEVAPGDCVRVTALVQEFNGLTELSGSPRVTILGSGTIPPPDTLHTGMLPDSAEAYEGGFAYVGPCIVNWTEDFFTYGQWNVNDGSGSGVLLADFGLEYEPEVGDSFMFVQGCVGYHSTPGHMIAPRSDADINYLDHRAPRIVSAVSVTEHFVNVRFNERLNETVDDDIANFRIIEVTNSQFPELSIVSAHLFVDGRTIQIETLESLPAISAYQLEVSQVNDRAGNVLSEAAVGFGGYRANPVTPIAGVYNYDKAHYDTVVVTFRGVVNFMQDVTTSSGSRRISAFIQDESGRGFSLSQSGAASTYPGIRRGNLIEITGKVSVFSGVSLQMGEFASGANSADVLVIAENQPLPAPIDIRTGDIRTQHEIVATSDPDLTGTGTWCRATGTVYQVDENVGGGTNIYFDDGSGNLTIRIWDSMELDSVQIEDQWLMLSELVGRRLSISGPSSTFNDDFQMLAGYAEDFADPSPIGAPTGKLILEVPNRPFAPDIGQALPIYYDAPATHAVRLRLFNLRGLLVHTFVDKRAGGPQYLDWDGRNELRELLPLGTYILHLESIKDGKTDAVTKPIVVGTRL